MSIHPALGPGRCAVITGAASGIGLATAARFASFGMNVVLADLPGAALEQATLQVAAVEGAGQSVAIATDVSDFGAVQALRFQAYERFGAVDVLMNNAGVGNGGGAFAEISAWRRVIDTNLWGVIHGINAFTARMVAQTSPALIINTGSKQGITTPPGDTAYNVSKAGVKVATEGLQHELRNLPNCRVTAHLLVPGFTFTGISGHTARPPGAWTADQVVDALLDGIATGRFYILCPDNDVSTALDQKRIRWAAEDVILNRPPLSRWHPDYREAFATFIAEND